MNTVKHIFLRYTAFLWALLKPLSPEQFARSLMQATGFTDSERLRATGKLVARSLSEAVELIYA